MLIIGVTTNVKSRKMINVQLKMLVGKVITARNRVKLPKIINMYLKKLEKNFTRFIERRSRSEK